MQISSEDIQSSSFGTFMLLALVLFSALNRELTLQIVGRVAGLFQVTLNLILDFDHDLFIIRFVTNKSSCHDCDA